MISKIFGDTEKYVGSKVVAHKMPIQSNSLPAIQQPLNRDMNDSERHENLTLLSNENKWAALIGFLKQQAICSLVKGKKWQSDGYGFLLGKLSSKYVI